jgi:hypothetical protein
MFKKAKAAFEEYNGFSFSDDYVQKIIDEDYNGDASALLAEIGRPVAGYLDDSWGDYETGEFY